MTWLVKIEPEYGRQRMTITIQRSGKLIFSLTWVKFYILNEELDHPDKDAFNGVFRGCKSIYIGTHFR